MTKFLVLGLLTFASRVFAVDLEKPPGPPGNAVPAQCFENPRLPGCPYWCRFHRKNAALCPGDFADPGNPQPKK